MSVHPYQMESLTSYIGRSAAMKSMDSSSFLRNLFPPENYETQIQIPSDLDAKGYGDFMAKLNEALDPEKRRLAQLTLPGTKPGVHIKWLRRAGGNCVDGDSFNADPAHAWCQRCLLEDLASGNDEFLRLSWRMITRTFCWKHRRPLATHCLDCNDRQASPAFVYCGGAISLVCGKCSSTYATQLGLPDMAASTALKLGKNHRVQAAWNGAIQFEMALERSLVDPSKKKDKGAFRDFSLAFANMLMRSKNSRHSPIDIFSSAAFPAIKNPANISNMSRPYRASSMAVRRKAHGLVASLLKNRVNLFSIKGLQQGQWGRDPTFQELRANLEPEQNAEIDRLLLRFPASWY